MRNSAQVDAFLEKCAEHGVAASDAKAQLLAWAEESLSPQAARALRDGFTRGKNTRDHYMHFAAFLEQRLQIVVAADSFRGLRRNPDVFGAFAQGNRDSIGILDSCLGEWEMVRQSYKRIEAGLGADWSESKAGRYVLDFKRPAHGDEVSFRFTDTVEENGWEGHAVAVEDFIFLSGVSYPEKADAVHFVLHRHPNDPSILVGMQSALFPTDDGRMVAVSRRMAAFRNHGKSARPRAVAQAWTEQDPMGIVVTLRESRRRRPQD